MTDSAENVIIDVGETHCDINLVLSYHRYCIRFDFLSGNFFPVGFNYFVRCLFVNKLFVYEFIYLGGARRSWQYLLKLYIKNVSVVRNRVTE